MQDDELDDGDECAAAFCASMEDAEYDHECLLAQTNAPQYVHVSEPAPAPGAGAPARYSCPAVPLLAPVDQLLRTGTLVFVFAAWLFNSDLMLFLAFISLCVNMCLCCGKPAVGCWMADIVIACVLLLVLLIRDTKYVVHLVLHGGANATHVSAG